ncbi:uncharacterized protein METZ01_LOCUS278959, partial [marine metagenome]
MSGGVQSNQRGTPTASPFPGDSEAVHDIEAIENRVHRAT